MPGCYAKKSATHLYRRGTLLTLSMTLLKGEPWLQEDCSKYGPAKRRTCPMAPLKGESWHPLGDLVALSTFPFFPCEESPGSKAVATKINFLDGGEAGHLFGDCAGLG